MEFSRRMTVVTLSLMFVLAAGIFWGPKALAAEPAELVKQTKKMLSSTQRLIVTDPSRAEKEWLEASKIITQLKEADPGHKELATLEQLSETLREKLEKRLGRPIGGTAKEENKETKDTPAAQEEGASDLPTSVTSRLDKLHTALDAVEAALEKEQLQTAERRLSEARKVIDEIQQRYATKIPAGNEQMTAALERLDVVGAKYSDAESSSAAAAAAQAEARKLKETQSQEWIDKFSPFFDSSGDQYLLMGSSFNSASEAQQEACRKAYARGNELMETYETAEFIHGKTQQLEYLEDRLRSYLTMYNEGEARAQQEEACSAWVETLRAYVDVGAGSRKYLVVSATLSETDINEREALLKEAQAVAADYAKAEFPLGKTSQLLDLEEEMQQTLEEMPEALRQSRALISGDIEKELDRVLGYLNTDTGWLKDMAKSPNIVMERDIKTLQAALERYAATVEPDDAKLATLQEKMTQIEQTDQKNRATRAQRTFMTPDRYDHDDADALRDKITDIVKENLTEADLLRITLPAADWKEEHVVEWTDTTRTAAQYRCTRLMTVQAAAKGADGKVYLHGIHVASDQKTDGTWGPLYGHIMWSDWMAEENVNKTPPSP